MLCASATDKGRIAGLGKGLQRCPVASGGLDEVPINRGVLREILRILGTIGNYGQCRQHTTELVRRQPNQAITRSHQCNPVESSRDGLHKVQRNGSAD